MYTLLIAAIVSQVEYIDHETIVEQRAEDMGKVAPHIIIDGHKLDYDAELKHYVFAAAAKTGPFAGQKTKAWWMGYTNKNTDKPVRMLMAKVNQIDLQTGKQYERQSDGEWKFNGCIFEVPADKSKPWTQWKQLAGPPSKFAEPSSK